MPEMVTVIKKKTYEEKEYLICLIDSDMNTKWELVIGRLNAYEYISDNVDMYTDFECSFVLAENVRLDGRISIPMFVKRVKEQEGITDSFDIDDFIKGDWDEDYFNSNQVDDSLSAGDKLSMEDILNGGVTHTDLN